MQIIELGKIAPVLHDGNLILLKTSKTDVIVGDARNEDAMNELRSLKQLSSEKGFRILFESDARLNRYVDEVPAIAWDIMDTADDPLVLILPKGKNVSNQALAQDGSIAVQMVKDPEEVKLVQRANCPLAITEVIDDTDSDSFSSIDYMINLPALFLQSSTTKKIPVIFLGLNNEVKVIRE